jgi:tRNA(Arg) A34 adenosine deaminase TadA
MRFPAIVLRLPDWVEAYVAATNAPFNTMEDRMRWVIELARLNVAHGTGGPFGAAIFDQATNRLLAPGVNVVVASHCSVAHAEMMAIMIAQQALSRYDLGSEAGASCELVTSTEPCAMCLGAIPWSGVHRVVCGARGEDACQIGFDEGAKPTDWSRAWEQRGITVERDICREEARVVLNAYTRLGGPIYNSRRA